MIQGEHTSLLYTQTIDGLWLKVVYTVENSVHYVHMNRSAMNMSRPHVHENVRRT